MEFDALSRSALGLADAFARKGEWNLATAVLVRASTSLGVYAPNNLATAAGAAKSLGSSSVAKFPINQYIAGPAAGPPAVSERDFETLAFVEWREPSRFRDTVRTLLSAYFRSAARQEPCKRPSTLNCVVSVPQLLSKNYHGYYGRITMRLMSFVPQGSKQQGRSRRMAVRL